MEFNQSVHKFKDTSNISLSVFLRYNLHEFLVVANCERLLILDANTNETIDVRDINKSLLQTLLGHQAPINALDASLDGIIVAISKVEVCFFVPTSPLQWSLSYKSSMQGGLVPLTVKISKIGDFCVLAGDKFVSLWTQDVSHDWKQTSYTQQIFYSQSNHLHADQMGQVLETNSELKGRIRQVEILGDGRMFFTLEEQAKNVKVWSQNRIRESSAVAMRVFIFQELDVYSTKDCQDGNILAMRIKEKSPNSIAIEPALLLTISQNHIGVHVESLMDTEMRFICIQTIKINARVDSFDAHFVVLEEQLPVQLSANPVLPHYLSKIFDTHRDEELKFKKRQLNNKYGVVPTFCERSGALLLGYSDIKFDYFIVFELKNLTSNLTLYKCKGVSNLPMRTPIVEAFKKIQAVLETPFENIIWASCYPCMTKSTPQNDIIRLVVTNERRNIFNAEYDVKQSSFNLVSVDSLFSNTEHVLLSQAHPDLALMSLVFENEIVMYSGTKMYGNYQTTGVKQLIWLPLKNQCLILRQNADLSCEVELVSSSDSEFKTSNKLGFKLDTYMRLTQIRVEDSAVGLALSSCSEQEQLKLNFCLLLKDGSIIYHCFEELTNLQIQHQEIKSIEPYQDGHSVLQLLCQTYQNGQGYILVHSESQIRSRTGKAVNFIRFIKLDTDSTRIEETFKLEIDVHHPVKCQMSKNIALISLVEGDYSKHEHVLYIYNFTNNQYLGYIRINEVLKLQTYEGRKVSALDFQINKKEDKLTILADQKAYLLIKQFGRWTLQQQIDFNSFAPSSLTFIDKFVIIDRTYVRQLPKFQKILHSSLPVFHPSLLKILYFKGYTKQVAQILAQLYLHLQDSKKPLPDISHIKFVEEVKVVATKQFNMFSDFDQSDSDSENIPDDDKTKDIDLVTLFAQQSDEIINAIIHSEESLNFPTIRKLELIEFIYKFRAIYQIDFYSDKLAVQVLNKVYYETEKLPQSDLDYAKSLLGLVQEVIQKAQPEVKPFSMEELINQRLMGAHKSQSDISGIKDWSSKMVSLALHSENQDVILDQLSQRLDFQNNLTWSLMRRLGIPLWLKSDFKLKQLIEIVAKNEYRLFEVETDNQQSQTKAEYSAIWYVLSNKVSVLRQLFNVELGGKKFAEFLESDFSQSKPKTIAGKNALALVAKRKNFLACAFFLLAQDLVGAVQVASERCQDPILSVLMCRILDPNNEQKQIDVIAERNFIQRGQQLNDTYLKSIGQWLKKEYVKSVNQLEPEQISQTDQMFQAVPEFNLNQEEQKDQNNVQGNNIDIQIYPTVAAVSFESLDLLVRLKKVPEVKRLLNKDWQLDKKAKKGGSIFDDFLGSGSSSEEEQQQQETISVKEDCLLETLLLNLIEKGYSQIALLLIQERAELVDKLSDQTKQKMAKSIIEDACSNVKVDSDQISSAIQKLQLQLKISVENSTVSKCLSQRGMFSAEMEYLLDNISDSPIQIFDQIDLHASSIVQFIKQSSKYSGRLFNTKFDQTDIKSKELLKVTQTIKDIVDVLIMFDNKPNKQKQLELIQSKKIKQRSPTQFDDSEDEIYSEAVPNAPLTNKLTNSSKLMGQDGGRLNIIELLGTLSYKCRIGVTLATTIYQLCIVSAKISLIPEIVNQLVAFLSVWNWSSATVTEALIKQNMDKLSFQKLKILVQRVEISIQKQIDRQVNKLDRKESKSCYFCAQDWFRFLSCFGTMDQVLSNALRILGNNKQQTFDNQVQVALRQKLKAEQKNQFMPSDLIQILDQQNRLFEQRSLVQFEYGLDMRQKKIFIQSLNQFLGQRQVIGNQQLQIDIQLLIKSQVKFKDFAKMFNLEKQLAVLEDLCLSARQINQVEQEIFKNGIELFKQKSEPIVDFQIKGDTLFMAMQGRGIREINIVACLAHRNRSNNMDLLDEELFSWYDCLHRFDNYQQIQVESKLEAVRQALLVQQNKKTLTNLNKIKQNQLLVPVDQTSNEFDGVPVSSYLKQDISFEINHEDFTTAICVHKKVPIYLTGNQRGIICLWQIGQSTDRSLKQWVCDPEIRQQDVSSKRQTIQKIEFSQHGDKFVVINNEGSLFIFAFEPENGNMPIASKKGLKISDFSILDGECSTLLIFSQSNKTLMILDLMTDQILNQAKVVGTDMYFDQVNQNIYTFNNKSGFIHRHDINFQVTLTKQIGKEEITSCLQFGKQGEYFAIGFADGILKIYSLKNGDFEQPKQQINIFTSVNGKKGPVTSLRTSTESGALYASSTLGCVKLAKVIIV